MTHWSQSIRRCLALCSMVVMLCACVSVTPDENRLRKLTRIYEQGLFQRVEEYRRKDLQLYLLDLVRRLSGDTFERAGVAPRVRIRMDVSPIATVYPHGLIVVNSGLLALVEDEAQLAAVLAHEVAHFQTRDFVRNERTELILRNSGAVIGLFVGAGLSVYLKMDPNDPSTRQFILNFAEAGAGTGRLVGRAYSRKLERDADERAQRLLESAGFRREALLGVLQLFASRAENEGASEVALGSFHPSLQDRIVRLRAQLAAPEEPAPRRTEGFPEAIDRAARALLVRNAELDCIRGRLDLGVTGLDRILARAPASAKALLVRADCLRRQPLAAGTVEPQIRAQLEAYRLAAAAQPMEHAPYGPMGMLYRRLGRHAEAVRAFEASIALAPDTPEAAVFRSYIARMQDTRRERESP